MICDNAKSLENGRRILSAKVLLYAMSFIFVVLCIAPISVRGDDTNEFVWMKVEKNDLMPGEPIKIDLYYTNDKFKLKGDDVYSKWVGNCARMRVKLKEVDSKNEAFDIDPSAPQDIREQGHYGPWLVNPLKDGSYKLELEINAFIEDRGTRQYKSRPPLTLLTRYIDIISQNGNS